MALAAIGAVGIGDYAEGAWVLVLFAVGTTLEALALDRSRRSVEALTELAPEEAQVLVDGVERTVAVAAIAPGTALRVRPGERVPLDGVIVDGRSSLDESALTGESVPVDKAAGDAVFAGTLNAFGALTVRTTAAAADTTLARVARLTAEAQASRAPQRAVHRPLRADLHAARVRAALLLAVVPVLLGGDLDTWLYRALALLIVACPCALVISVPVAVVSAVGGAARAGVLIKGGEALEALGRIDTVAVDKTGTLTEGRPRLASIEVAPAAEHEPRAVARRGGRARLGAPARSDAAARRAGARARRPRPPRRSPPCRGAAPRRPSTGGRCGPEVRVWRRTARERLPPEAQAVAERGETPVVLGEGTRVLAVFGLADAPRPGAADALAALRRDGVRRVVMLTGDTEAVARAVAGASASRVARRAAPGGKLDAVRDAAARTAAWRWSATGSTTRRRSRCADVGSPWARRAATSPSSRPTSRSWPTSCGGCPTRSGRVAARCGSSARTSSRRWR